MNKIPFIIHQTWKDANVPSHYLPWADSWKEKHPQWEHRLWTDDMNLQFIKQYAPGFLEIYEKYNHAIQRVDAVRYFILYHIGGLFIDLDFECLEGMEPLLENQECVFGIEPAEHCDRFEKDMIICNAWMGCSPGNNFFKAICEEPEKNPPAKNDDTPGWIEVLNSTGPFKLTEIYDEYLHKDEIKLIPSDLLYPFTIEETRELFKNNSVSKAAQKKVDRACAVHYFLGSWW